MTERTGELGPERGRGNRRAATTIVVVLLVLAGALYYASSYWRDTDPNNKAKSACPTSTVPTATPTTTATALQPAQITMTIYNATTRRGLAADTATKARALGFKVAAVGNDPLRKTITGPGELRFGPAGTAAATELARWLPGVVRTNDKRKGAGVDLVLGHTFVALKAPPTATPTPIPTC